MKSIKRKECVGEKKKVESLDITDPEINSKLTS